MTHTPGPWDVIYEPGRVWIGAPQRDDAKRYGIVATMGDTALAADAKSNARLIAAAPELLKALRLQASWTMRDGTPCACPVGRNEDEPEGKMRTGHSTACEYLRAAIAKVEGRTE